MPLSPFSLSSKNIWISDSQQSELGFVSGRVCYMSLCLLGTFLLYKSSFVDITRTSYLVLCLLPLQCIRIFSPLSSGNVYDAVLHLTHNMLFNTLIVWDHLQSFLLLVSELQVMHHSADWEKEINISFSSVTQELPVGRKASYSCEWKLSLAPTSV